MEFHEKLQELRKERGLTQEELAECLFVSRTAISKWESGRGYPSIDSLKEISRFYSVTIDELLSGDKLLSIAEKENKANIRNVYDTLLAILDFCTCMLIVLPIYPNTIGEHVYPVHLMAYVETSFMNQLVYWLMFGCLILLGMIKIGCIRLKKERKSRLVTECSMLVHILSVSYLALAREAYATMILFMLLVIKVFMILKYIRAGQ